MKNLHILVVFTCVWVFPFSAYAQKDENVNYTGYYQTIDIDPLTPCDCNSKTDRNSALNEHLIKNDIINYNLIAYKYEPLSTYVTASKLFFSIENDSSVHKISFMMSEHCFMLAIDKKFDKLSFEKALFKVFKSVTQLDVAEFLRKKNPALIEFYKPLNINQNEK
jgi:hypothetical protein